MRHAFARRLLVTAAVAALGGACGEPIQPGPPVVTQDSAALRESQAQLRALALSAAIADNRCYLDGYNPPSPGCTVTLTAAPANYHCATNCFWDGQDHPPQTDPITVTFSKPVYQLIVTSNGAFQCSGTYGTVTVYNRRGDQVEQTDFTITNPEDCGIDNATCCAVDSLQFPGGITRIVITPPQPWTFPVCIGEVCQEGRALVFYGYSFYERRQPDTTCLTGDELLDQQAMRDFLSHEWNNYSHPNDIPSNRREVRGWLFEDSTGNLVYGVYPDPTDTPCRSIGVVSGPMPGIPVAGGHTHPFTPGDTLPPNCSSPPLPPGTFKLYDVKKFGGPSEGDIQGVANDGVPGYVLDMVNIYVVPVGTTKQNAKTNVKRYPRVDPASGCVRI